MTAPLFPHADSIALLSEHLKLTVEAGDHWRGAADRAAAREPYPTQQRAIELFSRYAAEEERKAGSYRASLQLLFRGTGMQPARAWPTATTLPPPGPEVPVPGAHIVIHPAPTEGATK